MKLIEAVVNTLKLQEVRNVLQEMGVEDFVESSITCLDPNGRVMTFRGLKLVANVVEKARVEIFSADESAEMILQAIGAVFRTGNGADCRVGIRPYLQTS
jgi:nitrogen regulatory protein PII